MTINTERLETDAAYWDEVAPDGALYFNAEKRCFFNDVGFWTGINKEFVETFDPRLRMDRSEPQFIPRPTKPAAPEWVDGVPPVGCECEYRPDPLDDFWDKCIYLTHFRGQHFVIVLETGNVDRMPDRMPAKERFRPIPTQAQRNRDELSEVVAHASVLKGGTILEEWQYNCIADAILSRYNLEPKP